MLSYHSLLKKNPDSGGLGGLPPPPLRKRPPKRFNTWAATRVADLIYRRGPVLRAALGLPPAAAALPSAPSMIEDNAALTATIALKDQKIDALERKLAVCHAERADFADKLAKAKTLLGKMDAKVTARAALRAAVDGRDPLRGNQNIPSIRSTSPNPNPFCSSKRRGLDERGPVVSQDDFD